MSRGDPHRSPAPQPHLAAAPHRSPTLPQPRTAAQPCRSPAPQPLLPSNATATPSVVAWRRLQQRLELRDHLVLLLRKAMFNREEETRLTAVQGFLLLLQASAAGGHADAAAAGADSNVQFQLEVLGFIRRSFTQQASIRRALYEGLPLAFERLPTLREMILELLLAQLRQYDEADDGAAGGSTAAGRVELPLQIAKCLRFVGDERCAAFKINTDSPPPRRLGVAPRRVPPYSCSCLRGV